jgi:flagellar motor switch protein FliM
MPDRLSQQEIDALLGALTRGSEPAPPADTARQRGVKAYDFRHPECFSRDQLRSLRMIHEHFARVLAPALSTLLRATCTARLAGIDQLSYQEFIRLLPAPTCVAMLAMTPAGGQIVVELSPLFTTQVVDRLMGGRGGGGPFQRELTEIERLVLQPVFRVLMDSLEQAWRSLSQVSFALAAAEINPHMFLQQHLPTEMVLRLTLEATIGTQRCELNLGLPHVVLEPVLPGLSARRRPSGQAAPAADGQPAAHLLDQLGAVNLHACAWLGTARLRIRELLELQPGDVIPLDTRIDAPLCVEINGRPKFLGVPGSLHKHRAVKIVEDTQPGELN